MFRQLLAAFFKDAESWRKFFSSVNYMKKHDDLLFQLQQALDYIVNLQYET